MTPVNLVVLVFAVSAFLVFIISITLMVWVIRREDKATEEWHKRLEEMINRMI